MTDPDRPTAINSDFFDTLNLRSKIKLYAAVFFIFSAFGVLWDIGTPLSRPWYLIALWVLFSGGIAIGFAYAFTRRLKLLLLVVPLSIVIPTILEYLGRSGTSETDPTGGQVWHLVGSVVLVVVGYILFVRFIQDEGARSLRIRTEIALAERIHNNLVPPIDHRTANLEIRGTSNASSEVGGDLLDAVPDGDRMSLCVADVTGHGVQAGLTMAMLKSAVRMRLMRDDDLDGLVNDLNRVAMDVTPPGIFATAALMRFDGSTTAHVALAGHPPVLHYVARSGKISEIGSDHPPLGILDVTPYASSSVEFASGDVFVILTDGLTEVFDANDEEFGQERIEAIIRATAGQPLADIEAAILNGARQFGPQDDDQTVLLVRAL